MIDDGFRLLPEQASTLAPRVDALYYYLLIVSGTMTVIIAVLIVYFAIKYRAGSPAPRGPRATPRARLVMEVTWIVVPLILSMVMFFWGAHLYFVSANPPPDALRIDVVGRQWMWKFQHPEGKREINELHVPRGRAVMLNLISEDVIHSLYVPAFRVKHDALPSRYTMVWFQATKLGEYHLFCAEYCGAKHSEMIGRVVVMEPSQYQAWLEGGTAGQSPVEAGRALFEQMRCDSCHRGGAGLATRGPPLENLFRSQVRLRDGSSVIADEDYLRESILRPAAKVVGGYEPVMPPFEGQIGEEGLINLIAYIKSLSPQNRSAQP